MNWKVWLLLAIAGCFAAAALLTRESVPAEPEFPALTGRVVDRAGIFTQEETKQIESAILQLEKSTGGQMAVCTVKSLKRHALEEYSIQLAERWKIGRKGQDNGAILLLVPSTHQMRLEIGYGWEGKVNDARAGDILRSAAPFFRQEAYGAGVVQSVKQLECFITGKTPPASSRKIRQAEAGEQHPLAIVFVFVIFIVLLALTRGRILLLLPFFGGSGRGGGGGNGSFHGGGGGFGGGGASGRW